MNSVAYLKDLFLLLIAAGGVSFASSFLDVGTNTMLFRIWGEAAAPYLQFLHFCFGVGATGAPFVVALVIQWSPAGDQLFW
jgi:hypothetical protein